MKTVMASTKSQDSSSSKRHFHWTKKIGSEDDHGQDDHEASLPSLLRSSSSSRPSSEQEDKKDHIDYLHNSTNNNIEKQNHGSGDGGGVSSANNTNRHACSRRKLPQVAVARLRSVVLTAFGRNRLGLPNGLGPRVVGTLFGSRRGHVHFAFQKDPNSPPAFLIELATPISCLVKEMASGLVRIALECDKKKRVSQEEKRGTNGVKSLLEESVWRTYCNGKRSGFATRRDCGPKDWKILKAVEPISMGAGVLPAESGIEDQQDDNGHEVMYMRAKFERVVGSRDSEAFYMMNPDSNGAPELSIYLLRV